MDGHPESSLTAIAVRPTPKRREHLGGSRSTSRHARCAAPVTEKYTGVLAAADVFTESTAFWVMESIRLDLGYGSQVHFFFKKKRSVSTEQRENLDAILRQSAFPIDSDVNEQRGALRELLSAYPLPADVTVTAAALGGIPTAEITVDGVEPRHVVLYFHGGVYVLGDAFLAADLASQVGRRTQAKVISVDYRLAPRTRIRQRLTTLLRPMKPCWATASPLRTSPSRESPPGAASLSPPWSTPAITGCPCRPRPSSCRRMPTSPWLGRRWKPSARSTR